MRKKPTGCPDQNVGDVESFGDHRRRAAATTRTCARITARSRTGGTARAAARSGSARTRAARLAGTGRLGAGIAAGTCDLARAATRARTRRRCSGAATFTATTHPGSGTSPRSSAAANVCAALGSRKPRGARRARAAHPGLARRSGLGRLASKQGAREQSDRQAPPRATNAAHASAQGIRCLLTLPARATMCMVSS